jgi:hypothetical protein
MRTRCPARFSARASAVPHAPAPTMPMRSITCNLARRRYKRHRWCLGLPLRIARRTTIDTGEPNLSASIGVHLCDASMDLA